MKDALRILFLMCVLAHNAFAEREDSCSDPKATQYFRQGFDFQADNNTESAMEQFQKCLQLAPNCVACLYEQGWSFWKMGEWKKVIDSWELALKTEPEHKKIKQFLSTAQENLKIVESKNKVQVYRNKTNLLIQSQPEDAPVSMTFIGRWQAYNPRSTDPLDHFDRDIDSPKSANFSEDGKKVYVNSLEGGKTVVFDNNGTQKLAVISHQFKNESELFSARAPFQYRFPKSLKEPNHFLGKPVEGVMTHGGRYFWVTYYRRSYDAKSQLPSAMAIIDTKTNKIVRVMGTGPIAKYIQVSHKGNLLAVSHWGDNTVGIYDISGDNPSKFKEIKNLIVERQMSTAEMFGDRDKNCGFCVRGLAFTKDDKYLIVSRMKGGGIAIFNLQGKTKIIYSGSVFGITPGPRDLQLSPDGNSLYVGCNSSGYVRKVPVANLLQLLEGKTNANVQTTPQAIGAVSQFAGLGVRSLKVTHSGDYLFAAVNQGSELQAFRTSDMKLVSRIPVDSFPVGLTVSPDDSQVWVTSQGRQAVGGNSVGIFQIKYTQSETISITKDPRQKK